MWQNNTFKVCEAVFFYISTYLYYLFSSCEWTTYFSGKLFTTINKKISCVLHLDGILFRRNKHDIEKSIFF